MLEVLTLEVELVVVFGADEELLVVILVDLVTLALVVELWKTEVEEVLALLPVLV